MYRLNRVLYAEGSILLYGIQWQSLEVNLDNASAAILKAMSLQRKAILIKLGTMQLIDILRRKEIKMNSDKIFPILLTISLIFMLISFIPTGEIFRIILCILDVILLCIWAIFPDLTK